MSSFVATEAAEKIAWNLLRSSTHSHRAMPSLNLSAVVPRPLRSDEHRLVKKQLVDSSWDEGVIHAYLADPAVEGVVVEMDVVKLLFFGTAMDRATALPKVANEAWKLTHWLGVNETKPLIFLLFWRDDPRVCGASEWPNRRNVNGGWTIPGSYEIVVYRREEWDRVFLHEAIHTLEWDWKMPSKPLPCWGLGDHAVTAPSLFEAWTELYAEWLWCGWHNVPWRTQRAHMEKQAIQILARIGSTDWNENTNVFAYYVLKATLAPSFPFLWTFRNGETPEERHAILCEAVTPQLAALRSAATTVRPIAFSLRMTAA